MLTTFLISCATAFGSFEIPDGETQQKILLALRDEMVRLDGEGLLARKGRPESFLQTTGMLSDEALTNKTLHDFYNTFQRLSATYTNLHSRSIFPKEVEQEVDVPWNKNQSIWLFSEVDQHTTKIQVAQIDDPLLQEIISEGDEITAINGRSIDEWLTENFLFCKYTLKIQCDRMFETNLLNLNLSWKGNAELIYTIKHGTKLVDARVKFEVDPQQRDPLRRRCDWKADKRYRGFKLVHLGFFACLFEKEDDPTVAILRISSFQYKRNQNPLNPFKDIQEEVAALETVWLPRSANYKNLIIDVLGNTGGNLPIPYYQILFKGEFQEQYVQFKKTPEFENRRLRDAILWEDASHELQFSQYLLTGLWNSLRYGEFTPPEPMFCADPTKLCSETMFEAKHHDFTGKFFLMVDEICISSCDGFVWSLKTKLNAKLYGFYQAADGAYSRLRLDAILDSNVDQGFRVEVNPERAPLAAGLIVGQTIAVSRATDAEGNVFNGNPAALEKLVPYKLGESYPEVVLSTILKDLGSK